MRHSRLTIATMAAAGVSFLPTVSQAQAATDVLYGCYAPNTGRVYLIKQPGMPTECDKKDSQFHWNVRGDVGPQGERGAAGAQGAVGVQGATGPQGERGFAGPVGATGAKGDQGATGANGPMGDRGPQGETGAQGEKGATGEKGDVGQSGQPGEIGPTGPKGDVGPQGDAGPKGSTGLKGDVGPQGDAGATGATGAKGDAGAAGPAGLSGLVGVPQPQIYMGIQQSIYPSSVKYTCPAGKVAVGLSMLALTQALTNPNSSQALNVTSKPGGDGTWSITLSSTMSPVPSNYAAVAIVSQITLYCVTAF